MIEEKRRSTHPPTHPPTYRGRENDGEADFFACLVPVHLSVYYRALTGLRVAVVRSHSVNLGGWVGWWVGG